MSEPAGQPLRDLQVLVVEDNYVLAESLRWALEGLGCVVVGPAPTAGKALELIDRSPPQAAILDIDLHGESCTPVAVHLRAKQVPFLFLTGYENSSLLPDALRDVPCLSKPVHPEILASTLTDQVLAARSRT